MNARLVGLSLLLLPCAAAAWSGDTWANINRETIKATADQMIDSTWTPKNTFTNYQYSGSYRTYYQGTTYTGVAYSQNNPQENWSEFSSAVSNTSGGSVGYGNDCSGFVSICWRLPSREVTAWFESKLGGTAKWFSLGDIGTAATAPLVMGDALNSSSVGHIVLFLNRETSGILTMEQTPTHAQRKVRSYSNLAEYRPIRRMQIVEAPLLSTDGLSRVVDAGNAVSFRVTASGTAPFTYRWKFNGNYVAGATSSQLTLASAQLTNAGDYVCVVTNAYGSVTSRVMSLTVYPAQMTVFLDTFETNSAALWQLNRSSTDTRAIFNYDYSAMGIPSAPRSTGGTTRGLRMGANLTAGATAAVSLSPLNRSCAGDYRLRFDLWLNANGPFPPGGTGSSQHVTAGVGTAGTRTQWTGSGSTADGYWFAVDGEGQASDTSSTSGDFCAYAGTSLRATSTGVYTAGTESNAKANVHPYHLAAFPGGTTAPAWQQANYAQQTGALTDGTVGFVWREVIVARRGNVVDWAIDGVRLATFSNATFTASNVFVGYWDMFTSLSDNTNLSFGVVDNVRVEVPITPPVITNQPQNQTVNQGSEAAFSVGATGIAPLGYQWRFDGANIAGATLSGYACSGCQPAHAGGYSVVVGNAGGAVTSAVAILTVNVPPSLLAPLPSQTVVTQGNHVVLCVTATGTLPLSYQWRYNGTDLFGATTSCYSRNNVQTNDAGTYAVVVGNVAGSLTNSTVLTVLVTNAPPAQAARFDSLSGLPEGALHLDMSGTPGANYILEWTTDWLMWSNLCTLSGSNGLFWTIDPCITNGAQRFYRLRLAP